MPSKPRLTPRKVPRQDRSRFTVDAILMATVKVLVEEGWEKASTNQIAKIAGVSVGSLYQYFPSKESLASELFRRQREEVVGAIDARLTQHASAPVPKIASELVGAMTDAYRTNPDLVRVLVDQVPRIGAMRKVAETDQLAVKRIADWLRSRSDLRSIDPDLAAFLVFGTLDALVRAAVLERPDALAAGAVEAEIATVVAKYLS